MALTDTPTQSETPKEPRLYSRGNDQVELDAYIRDLDSGFDAWLNSRKIKDKYKTQLRDFHRTFLNRLNSGDGSLTYTLGGGFDDSTGAFRNAGKESEDILGWYARYAGNILRGMNVYKKPDPKPDPSKIKYSDSAVGTAINRFIYGRDTGNLQDFLDLDTYDETAKTRANTNRTARFRQGLEHVRDHWDELFSDFTDQQKSQALANIEDAFTTFTDGNISDNEYLALSRATGMNNLRDMFAINTAAPGGGNTPGGQAGGGRTYADFIRWAERNYAPYTGNLPNPISLALAEGENYCENTQSALINGLADSQTTDDQLYSLITLAISGADLNNHKVLRRIFPNDNPRFSSQYITNQVLETLKSRGRLHNFGADALNKYYIPNTRTSNNTGYVWDSTGNTLSEMSIHNIPYWQQRILNEWRASGDGGEPLNSTLTSIYPAFKQGGILKADGGAVMPRTGIPSGGNWLNIENTASNAANVGTWDNYYNMSGIMNHIGTALNWRPRPQDLPAPKLADDDPNASLVRNLTFADLQNGNYSLALLDAYLESNYGPESINKFWEHDYRKDSEGNIIKNGNGETQYGLSAGTLGILLNKLNTVGANLSWDKTLNATGYDEWNRLFDQTGLNEYFGGDLDRFNYMGPSTYNRHALLEQMKGTYTSDNPLLIGNDKIYWNATRNRWDMVRPEIGPARLTVDIPQIDPSTLQLAQVTLPGQDGNGSHVDEGDLGAKNPNDGQGLNRLANAALELTPDLIGAGRLYASLHTNNRVADVIRPSLSPVLKDTYERYSPVTGAFSEMLFRNRQAANTSSLGGRIAGSTSDASLGAATMLDANRQAVDQQYQGFLADDREIRRTQAEALARQEDNMARRSDVANFNRASINQTNREIAQLEATRLNKNWQSWDNYLAGIETRMRTRFDQARDERNNFQETVSDDMARRQYEDLIKPANDALAAWQAGEGSGKLVTAWDQYDRYVRFMNEAANRYKANRLLGRADIYGYRYTNPYADDNPEIPFGWSSYRKQGGRLIPKSKGLIPKTNKKNK